MMPSKSVRGGFHHHRNSHHDRIAGVRAGHVLDAPRVGQRGRADAKRHRLVDVLNVAPGCDATRSPRRAPFMSAAVPLPIS